MLISTVSVSQEASCASYNVIPSVDAIHTAKAKMNFGNDLRAELKS